MKNEPEKSVSKLIFLKMSALGHPNADVDIQEKEEDDSEDEATLRLKALETQV